MHMTLTDWTLHAYRPTRQKSAKWSWSQAAALIVLASALLWWGIIALVWHVLA